MLMLLLWCLIDNPKDKFLRFGLYLSYNILLRMKDIIIISICFKEIYKTKTMREFSRCPENIVAVVNYFNNHLSVPNNAK